MPGALLARHLGLPEYFLQSHSRRLPAVSIIHAAAALGSGSWLYDLAGPAGGPVPVGRGRQRGGGGESCRGGPRRLRQGRPCPRRPSLGSSRQSPWLPYPCGAPAAAQVSRGAGREEAGVPRVPPGRAGLRRAVLPAARGLLPDSRPPRSPARRFPRPGRLGAAGWGAAAGLQGRRGGLWVSPAAPPGPVRKNLSFSPRSLRAAQCRGSR